MISLRKSVLNRVPKRLNAGRCTDCSPVHWSRYFESIKTQTISEQYFQVYIRGSAKPMIVALHGGGYSGLTWGLLAEELTNKVECQVVAIDLRGHGNTKTSNDGDLSLKTLANDVASVVNSLCEESNPEVIVIGHSLGGAVAVEAALLIKNCVGVCVIDVVEGTALEALSSMQQILRGRPSSFKSIESAIEWSFRGGQTHNLEAARVSMPGQIKNIRTDKLAAMDVGDKESESENSVADTSPPELSDRDVLQRSADSIEEEDEDLEAREDAAKFRPPVTTAEFLKQSPPGAKQTLNRYTWRIDLAKTEPFWGDWFKGLSQKFLQIPVAKVLLLANIHGLDTTLTVGQMQGKFQLQVLPRSGHAIHEDQPQQVADIIAGFLVKNKFAVALQGFVPSLPAC